ncbi:MAG: MaoC family dehydratase [Pseudomonadales bacterium]|nr:MaoC family dehydratase [Pseudomonadales bacterium]MCP5182521.1 MaoC family dehydratase [Pseudomonadales bacterium]
MSDSTIHRDNALAILKARIGQPETPSEWFEITQDRIDAYAEVSMDHQWIHVDVARARSGPFGTPIAHGNLTLAVMDHLPRVVDDGLPPLEGHRLSINYGYDRIRFPSPVKVGARIRSTNTLVRAEVKGDMIETATEIRVDIEGGDKPALVAEKLRRLVF